MGAPGALPTCMDCKYYEVNGETLDIFVTCRGCNREIRLLTQVCSATPCCILYAFFNQFDPISSNRFLITGDGDDERFDEEKKKKNLLEIGQNAL